MVISNTANDNRITFKEAMAAESIVSMIVTPIPAREKVIGVMRLYSGDRRQFPEEVLLMVKALAHQGDWQFRTRPCICSSRKTRHPWRKISGATAPGFK